jgi:hypothetical protein
MPDYYPMVARCVADLEENTAIRHEFYWLARAELAVELCGLNPRLTQSEIARERLALDEAIRKVEAACLRSQASPPTPKPDSAGHESTRGFSDIHLCSDMRLVTQGQQRQPSGTVNPESLSTSTAPLILKFAGALVVIAWAVTLYWQGHRFTAPVGTGPTTPSHQAVKSSPTLTYYVGQLGELASVATRRLDRLVLPDPSDSGRNSSAKSN